MAWVPLALAAVLAVAVFGAWRWATQPRYEWRVTDVVAPAGILAATGDVQLGAAQRGGLLQTGEGSEIELQLGGEFRFRMLGGSVIELPPPPPRWYSGEILITVHDGEIYGTTGAAALDLPLARGRPQRRGGDPRHDVRGLPGNRRSPASVCGRDRCGRPRASRDRPRACIARRDKVMFYADGTVSESLPLEPMERMKLQMMADGGVPPPPAAQK